MPSCDTWLQERIRPSVLAELREQRNTFRAPHPLPNGCVLRAGIPRRWPPRALARPSRHLRTAARGCTSAQVESFARAATYAENPLRAKDEDKMKI